MRLLFWELELFSDLSIIPQTGVVSSVFGFVAFVAIHRDCPAATAGTENGPADAGTATPGRVGKASPSMSIFALQPLCPNTCRHCRCKPCDIATDHDDHIFFFGLGAAWVKSRAERPSVS